jgi:hypothetical protein
MFRKAGIPIKNKRVTEIVAGVAITDTWFRAKRLFIYESCPNLIRELRGYQWDTTRKGLLKDSPKGGSDHAADALRYAISSHKYGVAVTEAVALPPTEAEDLEKLIRLGLAAEDPDAQLKELEALRQKERLNAMAFGTDDDSDPFGIWS